ncbi:hypothetical protein QTP88_024123 [Uroleucon formosanum]
MGRWCEERSGKDRAWCQVERKKSISAIISFSMDNTDNETRRSLAIVDFRYVFMRFNLEKLRSPIATVTSNVNNLKKSKDLDMMKYVLEFKVKYMLK